MLGSEDRTIAGETAFFVCGVVSDRQGFEYVELGPKKLPGSPSSYLDVYPSTSGDQSYGFELLDIGGDAFIRYSRYLRINPNDSQTNRGAYLAVGFLSSRALALHVAANCIDLVSQIFGHLKSFIGPDNSLGTNFKLEKYSYESLLNGPIESHCSPVLQLDVLMQGLNMEGPLSWRPGKPIFLEAARLAREADVDRHLFYFAKGTPSAQLGLDRERQKLKTLSQKLALAASYADQVQDEWLSYQSMIQEHLPSIAKRGTELRQVIDEVERLTRAVDDIEAPTGTPKSTFAPVGGPASGTLSSGGSIVSQRPRSAAGQRHRFTSSRRREDPHRRNLRRSFGRVALGIGGALVLGAIFMLAVRLLDFPSQPSDAERRAGPVEELQEIELPERSKPADSGTADGSRSGVAQERAALGEPPPE